MDCIAYIRVSTQRQGNSGLGLEAQIAAVITYIKSGSHTLIATYREVESGKTAHRPQLKRATDHCRRTGATLLVAKLDRLARNHKFVVDLMESQCEFVACDNPHATRLTLHILSAVADDEARRISERTKAALAAYKARGGRLGTPGNMTKEAALKGATATRDAAKAAYAILLPSLVAKRAAGCSLRQLAAWLNSTGYPSRKGKPWNHKQVARVLAYAKPQPFLHHY